MYAILHGSTNQKETILRDENTGKIRLFKTRNSAWREISKHWRQAGPIFGYRVIKATNANNIDVIV